MKKRIVIIGANSALAQDVIPVLAKDHEIITAGRKGCDIICDVTKPFSMPHGVDTVINFAAAFGGAGDEEINDAEKTNVGGMLNICIAAQNAGVKYLLNISSIFALLDETSPYFSIYALTKKQGDEMAQFYCREHGIQLAILRPSQIYGDSNRYAKHQPFLYHIVDKAQSGEDIELYGTHDAKRNYIHAADVAEIISLVIQKQVEGVYACAYPADVTYSFIAHTAQGVFNKGGETIFLKDKPEMADNIFTPDSSLYEAIDYHPQISVESGLKRVKEYRERPTP